MDDEKNVIVLGETETRDLLLVAVFAYLKHRRGGTKVSAYLETLLTVNYHLQKRFPLIKIKEVKNFIDSRIPYFREQIKMDDISQNTKELLKLGGFTI